MEIEMVAAMDRNRVIAGSGGGVPWDLPRDVARFREIAAGRTMVVGRKTYEEMEGWFTGQTPIVLTKRGGHLGHTEGTLMAGSVGEVLEIAGKRDAESLLVAGGAEVFTAFLKQADRLSLTRVDAAFEGSALFPEWEESGEWERTAREEFLADSEHNHAFAFETWLRSP